tara:strand:- start:639 stop:824 length:186 start_codon:yes stop_codon:yes gene_type:complete
MKIKQKKILKQLKKKAEHYKKEAKLSAENGDYDLAHEEMIIVKFIKHHLIYGIETGEFFED